MNESEKIKIIRNYLKMTQEQFACILGVTKQYISLVETNKSEISKEKLVKLALDYKINLNWLLTDLGSMFLSSDQESNNTMLVKLKRGQILKVEYEE